MRTAGVSIIGLLSLLVCASLASADMTFSDGLTHVVDTTLPPGNIGLSNNSMLNIAPTGRVTGTDNASIYANENAISADYSIVTVNGGAIYGGQPGTTHAIDAWYSTVNMNSGTIAGGAGTSYVFGVFSCLGTVNINGGTITGGTGNYAYGIAGIESTVTVYSGTIAGGATSHYGGAIQITGTVNVFGGTIKGYAVASYSDAITGDVVNIHGGDITGSVEGSKTLNLVGGNITGSGHSWNFGVITRQGSTASIEGGSITINKGGSWNYGIDNNGGIVNISGGDIHVEGGTDYSTAIMCHSGTVNITGGHITYSGTGAVDGYTAGVQVTSGATINIYGGGFNYPDGPIADLTGELKGTLQDGTAIDLTFWRGYSASNAGQIILYEVPEPASMTLLGAGAAVILRRRRR